MYDETDWISDQSNKWRGSGDSQHLLVFLCNSNEEIMREKGQ